MVTHHCGNTAAIIFSASIAAISCTAHAQDIEKPFDIPAGPATTTINVFARQAGINILASEENLNGIITHQVQGSYPVSAALRKLLSGTGLESKVTSSGAVFVMAARGDDSSDSQDRDPDMINTELPLPRKAACCAVSAALMLMGAPLTEAQAQATAQVQAQPDGTASDDVRQVIVVGQRQAEQSAIDRKKYAPTAMDSLVADDIGSLPDRNVAEAISRIAGVTLERGEFGEGVTVNIRGVAADQTRVELDGLAVASPGGTDLEGGGGGRGTELRDLPAELIASVDVVKGSTVDMTEGSLGGGVIIKTRTGLDFAKPFFSMRANAGKNSLNNKWAPSGNLIYAQKFLDGRVGLLLNVSSSKTNDESHSIAHNQDLRYGYARTADYDQSPEKTVALNPAYLDLRQASVTAPIGGPFAVNDGGAQYVGLNVKDIMERSYAAQSKEDCFAAFPLQGAQFNRITSAANRATAQSTQANALVSCLNQWNDYAPHNLRYYIRTQKDERLNADLRLDFKVTKNLTLYTKFARADRDVTNTNNALSLGNLGPSGTATNWVEGPVNINTPALRSLSTAGINGGYFILPGTYSNRGVTSNNFNGLANGVAVGAQPGSIKVDSTHHVTEAILTNGGAFNDMINQFYHTEGKTIQTGGNYRNGRFKAEFLAGKFENDFWRYGLRSSLGFNYGPVRVVRTAEGIFDYDFSAGVNPLSRITDPNLYVTMAAPTAAGQPSRGAGSQALQLRVDGPRAGETAEKNFRLDTTYSLGGMVPFLGNLKAGVNRRVYEAKNWTATQNTEISPSPGPGLPNLYTSGLQVTNNLRLCENTPGSLAPGGTPCNYGFTLTSKVGPSGGGDYVLTQDEFKSLLSQMLTYRTAPFFNGAKYGPSAVTGWVGVDAAKGFEVMGYPPVDVDCIKACIANDGNVYERPRSSIKETVTASYLSTDFNIDRVPFTQRELPFGWELDGNFGWRIVQTDTAGTGSLTFTAITKNSGWNEATPNENITTTTLTRNITLARKVTDYMPVLNLALWPVKDKLVVRYNRAKTIARPPMSRLISGDVTCTFDERTLVEGAGTEDDEGFADQSCRGNTSGNSAMGNPGLRAVTNYNSNLSFEAYPNRDTLVGLALFQQKGIIGNSRRIPVTDQRPFAGSGVTTSDGRSLDDVEFKYDTWTDGPANSRKGIELSGKTAFTFLPSVLRYTGINANFTKVKSKNFQGENIDFTTGDVLSPFNEYKYSWNTALWYDDGKLNARVALQVNSEMLMQYQTSSGNPFPANNIVLSAVSLPLTLPTVQYRDARRFVDAKVGYKFDNGIEVFVEGRNLTNQSLTNSNGIYSQFEQGRAILDTTYSGRRLLAGLSFRMK